MVGFDASAHDAHQHIHIMQTFDDMLIRAVLSHGDHSLREHSNIYDLITLRKKKFYIRSTHKEKGINR